MDRALIEKAKNGDKSAFTKLYEELSDKIKKDIMYIVKDETLADELLNDTFIKVWRKLDTYTQDISFQAWVKMIAVNCCIDHFRRNSDDKFVHIDDSDITLQLPDNAGDVIARNELSDIVNTALLRIPFAKRRALELYYFNNLPYKEIAKLLRMPLGTVKSDINRAKKKLSNYLQKFQNNENPNCISSGNSSMSSYCSY
jgi:RNA polymerase sigma-70 factor (ECF subfamily)